MPVAVLVLSAGSNALSNDQGAAHRRPTHKMLQALPSYPAYQPCALWVLQIHGETVVGGGGGPALCDICCLRGCAECRAVLMMAAPSGQGPA
jgi:hypothetical protein